MEVKLHVVRGNPKGKVLNVPEGARSIGRAETNDLIIASTRVSRNHCEVVNDGQSVILRDKGSSNGSFVNGERVREQVLKPGDRVVIGPLEFVVEIDGQREAPEAPGAPATPPQAEPEPVSPSPPAPTPETAPPQSQPSKPPAPQPQAAPPRKPETRGGGEDVLASLERMAGTGRSQPQPPATPPQKPPEAVSEEDEGVLRISDEDLLDE